MNFTREDFRKLQLPALILLAALVLAWLIVTRSSAREQKAVETLQQQTAELEKARQQLQASGSEKDNIIKYMPLYEGLIKRGFIGEEQRVDWISDLRNINQKYKLFGVSYDIAAQEEYKPKFPVNAGRFKIHRSVMKLSFALLHESDLLTPFEALPAENNAPFMLRDCTVTRTSQALRSKFEPNLNATCELDWLTVEEPKAKATP
jgi:hypothetical protein